MGHVGSSTKNEPKGENKIREEKKMQDRKEGKREEVYTSPCTSLPWRSMSAA